MTRRLAVVVLAAVALAPALATGGVRPAYGGTLRIGVAAGTDLAALVERATSAPLLELDAAGALVPGALAEVPVPEAGARAFRLRVRTGLTDAAGRPLGAADVAERLAAVLARDARSPDAWAALPVLGADALLDGRAPVLAGVQLLSASELLVTLAFPLPELPWLLASPALALPRVGPFTPAPRRTPADAAVLVHDDRNGRPFASALEIRTVDARAAARLLEQGGLDLVVRPEAAGTRAAVILPALTVTVAALQPGRLGTGAAGVRAALAGVDRAELARRFVRGPAEPLRIVVPPSILPGPATDEPAPGAGPSPARVALLADASEPDQRALAERLQVKLFDRGVRATVELVDGARYRTRLAAGDYDVALVSVRIAALRPALAAGQVAFAARGAEAARRTMAALAGLEGEAATAAAVRAGRDLDLVPLVAAGARVSTAPALQGLSARADGGLDVGGLWLLGGGALP